MTAAWLALAGVGCVPLQGSPVEQSPVRPLEIGESRSIVLHTFELNVEDYRLVLDRADLEALPAGSVEALTLLDLPLDGLVQAALQRLVALPRDQVASLSPPSANVQRLLGLTPDGVSLDGTSFAPLEDLSQQVGIPLARPLADLFQVEATEPLLAIEEISAAVAEGLVDSHPAVEDGALPVTLADLLGGFSGLADRLGPVDTVWGPHPGVVTALDDVRATDDAFRIQFAATANAVPFAGVDLTDVSDTRVNSIGAQIETLFDFESPDWIEIDGLVDPVVGRLSLQLAEDATAHLGSPSREAPLGSTAWALAPWYLERIVADAALRTADALEPVRTSYASGTGAELFALDYDDTGWVEVSTFADVGPPPPPAHLWDVVLEIAQARLHDDGVEEGNAVGAFTFDDLPLGLTAEQVEQEVRDTLTADPAALRPLAVAVTQNSAGASDLFYRPVGGLNGQEDWLFFVLPDDIPEGMDGPVRPYEYSNPGFFADEDLSQRVSAPTLVADDAVHEKVQVFTGDVLYVGDDADGVYEIVVRDKPSRAKIALDVARLR